MAALYIYIEWNRKFEVKTINVSAFSGHAWCPIYLHISDAACEAHTFYRMNFCVKGLGFIRGNPEIYSVVTLGLHDRVMLAMFSNNMSILLLLTKTKQNNNLHACLTLFCFFCATLFAFFGDVCLCNPSWVLLDV